MSGFNRRQATRAVITGSVTITAQSGPAKGITYKGILQDMSDGGVRVLLENECGLTRGTEIALGFVDAPSLRTWLCHNTRAGEDTWSLGMSFAPVDQQTTDQQSARSTADSAGSEHTHCLRVDDDLSLQIWQEADAGEAFEVIRESRSHLEQWVEWAPQVHSADNLREFIRYSLEQYRRGKTWQFAIRQHGRIAGGIGLVVRSGGVGEIGYWLGSACERRGIVTRCAQTIIRFGFATLSLNSIEIRCAVSNERSRAVAERLGFTPETILPSSHWTSCGMQDLVIYRSNRHDTALESRNANLRRVANTPSFASAV